MHPLTPCFQYYHSRESTLFLLEATPTMLAPILEQASPAPRNATQSSTQAKRSTQRAVGWKGGPAKSKMELCLRSAYAMMKRKVISAPKDSVGVLIFNTVRSCDPGNEPGGARGARDSWARVALVTGSRVGQLVVAHAGYTLKVPGVEGIHLFWAVYTKYLLSPAAP